MVVVVRVVMQLLPHLVVLVAVHLLAVLVIYLVGQVIRPLLHHLKVTTGVQVALTQVLTMPLVVVVRVQ
jgi:hypothetical protein